MLGTITEHSEAILARGLAVFLIPSCLSAVPARGLVNFLLMENCSDNKEGEGF